MQSQSFTSILSFPTSPSVSSTFGTSHFPTLAVVTSGRIAVAALAALPGPVTASEVPQYHRVLDLLFVEGVSRSLFLTWGFVSEIDNVKDMN